MVTSLVRDALKLLSVCFGSLEESGLLPSSDLVF